MTPDAQRAALFAAMINSDMQPLYQAIDDRADQIILGELHQLGFEIAAISPNVDEGVTQEDRDRAASIAPIGSELAGMRRRGAHDGLGVVQAFRAHRVAALRGSEGR